MRLLDPERRAALRGFLPAERPGPLVAPHVLRTGQGACFVDRWPVPRALVASVADNVSLLGDPAALRADHLQRCVQGFVDAAPEFVPGLREVFPDLGVWDRIVFELPDAPRYSVPHGAEVRRLRAADAHHVWGLSPDLAWIAKTLGGPSAAAASGLAFGAFVGGELAAMAVPFFAGERYEDFGVVTEAAHRGRGLSPACAGRLAEDVRARGRIPSWTTAPDNLPSLRVARKLGFREHRIDVLYLVGVPVPEVARP